MCYFDKNNWVAGNWYFFIHLAVLKMRLCLLFMKKVFRNCFRFSRFVLFHMTFSAYEFLCTFWTLECAPNAICFTVVPLYLVYGCMCVCFLQLYLCKPVPTHRSTQLHRKKKMKQRSKGAQTEIIIDLIT